MTQRKQFLLEEVRLVSLAAGASVSEGDGVSLLTASGYAITASGAATADGERFQGIALEDADNSAGSDGDVTVKVGVGIFELPATNANRTLIGSEVVASDATHVSGSATGVKVGRVEDYISATALKVWVGKPSL